MPGYAGPKAPEAGGPALPTGPRHAPVDRNTMTSRPGTCPVDIDVETAACPGLGRQIARFGVATARAAISQVAFTHTFPTSAALVTHQREDISP